MKRYPSNIVDCTTFNSVLAIQNIVDFGQNDKNCTHKKTFCQRNNKDKKCIEKCLNFIR